MIWDHAFRILIGVMIGLLLARIYIRLKYGKR